MIEHSPQLGPDAVKFGSPDGPFVNSSCGGKSALATRTRGKPMNATNRSEEIETESEVDTNLAAVSEVEAGIRDFVRNDIAYLRRPVVSTETAPPEPSADATVNNVNSLIQRVAGTSLAEIEKLISELESLRDLL